MIAGVVHRAYGRRCFSLVLLLFAVVLFPVEGCRPVAEKKMTRREPPATEKDKLLLIRRLPLGADFQEVKSCFPKCGPMVASTIEHATVDSELVVFVKVLDRDAELKFVFQKHLLVSYSFDMPMLDSLAAADLNAALKELYTTAFGNYHEFLETDRDVSTWSEGETEIQVTNRRAGATFQLFWEFRKLQPGRRPV